MALGSFIGLTACNNPNQSGEKYSEGLEYEYINDSEIEIIGKGTCTDENLIIPSTYKNRPVTSIGIGAFKDCDFIKSISFPKSITNIGDQAFVDCDSLLSINIPEGVTYIGELAFSECDALANITLPSTITKIVQCAFENTAFFNDPSNWDGDVLYIGKYLIKAKTTIQGEYTIKNGTEVIATHAFSFCTSLTGVLIPDGVKYIGSRMLENCSSVFGVEIPDSVLDIGHYSFINCTSLQYVVIGCNVASMGYSTFENCTSLESVTFTGTKIRWTSVSKLWHWRHKVPATSVQCIDGIILINVE